MERLLKLSKTNMSVDKVLALAQTIVTIQITLHQNKQTISKTILIKRHQQIAPLFSDESWVRSDEVRGLNGYCRGCRCAGIRVSQGRQISRGLCAYTDVGICGKLHLNAVEADGINRAYGFGGIESAAVVLRDWLRNRYTIEFPGT